MDNLLGFHREEEVLSGHSPTASVWLLPTNWLKTPNICADAARISQAFVERSVKLASFSHVIMLLYAVYYQKPWQVRVRY